MIDINITIHCPDLVTAAGALTAALSSRPTTPLPKPPVPPQEAPQPPVAQTPAPAPTAQPAPTVTHQMTTGDPLPENVVQITSAAPAPAAPVAPTTAPSYTAADIARAGAMLIQANPGIQPQLQTLLQQFGVRAAMDLKPDQLSNFANALRGLGAKL